VVFLFELFAAVHRCCSLNRRAAAIEQHLHAEELTAGAKKLNLI
jgi:hypothetical protein